MVSAPASAFASWIAARSVHTFPAAAHVPLPGLLSAVSFVLFTTNVAAAACVAVVARKPATAHVRAIVRMFFMLFSLFSNVLWSGSIAWPVSHCANLPPVELVARFGPESSGSGRFAPVPQMGPSRQTTGSPFPWRLKTALPEAPQRTTAHAESSDVLPVGSVAVV